MWALEGEGQTGLSFFSFFNTLFCKDTIHMPHTSSIIMHISVVSSTFAGLCNQYHYVVPEHSITLKEAPSPSTVTSIPFPVPEYHKLTS